MPTPPNDPDPQRWCLRALQGPLAGAVFLLDERLEMGRSSRADIQLIGLAVSRSHAVVMRGDDPGRSDFVLVDTLSTNGTWLGSERVQRHTLRPGDRFTIGDSEFLFEPVASEAEFENPSIPRVADERAQRPTQPEDVPVRAQPRAPTGPASRATSSARATQAVGPDGAPYPGNLLADIVLYRNLRLHMSRGGAAAPLQQRCAELEAVLRMPQSEVEARTGRRTFARFICSLPGKLAFEGSRTPDAAVTLLDLAVDGARLTAIEYDVTPNQLGWLSVPLITPQGLRSVVFTIRAVWVRSDQLGVVFSGAPSWSRRNRTRETATTKSIEIKKD